MPAPVLPTSVLPIEMPLLESPALIDCILIVTVVEAVALAILHRKTGLGLSTGTVARMLLPGVCLMLALRAALSGVAWPFVPIALTAALITHLADLRGRWRGR